MAVDRGGRRPGFRMSDEHRIKIQNSAILQALIEHVEGTRDMSQSQVTAALGLLRKILPDLANVTLSNGDDGPLRIVLESDAARL